MLLFFKVNNMSQKLFSVKSNTQAWTVFHIQKSPWYLKAWDLGLHHNTGLNGYGRVPCSYGVQITALVLRLLFFFSAKAFSISYKHHLYNADSKDKDLSVSSTCYPGSSKWYQKIYRLIIDKSVWNKYPIKPWLQEITKVSLWRKQWGKNAVCRMTMRLYYTGEHPCPLDQTVTRAGVHQLPPFSWTVCIVLS